MKKVKTKSVVNASTGEQQRRGVTLCGEGGAADPVTNFLT